MNIDKDTLISKINALLALIQRHALFLGIVGFSLVYGYIIWQVSSLVAVEPSEKEISEQLKRAPRPKLDKEAARIIENLESENINVQTVLNEARENPFSE